AEAALDRCAESYPVRAQVLQRDVAGALLQRGSNRVGQLSLVEVVGSRRSEALQSLRQVGAGPVIPRLLQGATSRLAPESRRVGRVSHALERRRQAGRGDATEHLEEISRRGEATPRQLDRGLQQIGP